MNVQKPVQSQIAAWQSYDECQCSCFLDERITFSRRKWTSKSLHKVKKQTNPKSTVSNVTPKREQTETTWTNDLATAAAAWETFCGVDANQARICKFHQKYFCFSKCGSMSQFDTPKKRAQKLDKVRISVAEFECKTIYWKLRRRRRVFVHTSLRRLYPEK